MVQMTSKLFEMERRYFAARGIRTNDVAAYDERNGLGGTENGGGINDATCKALLDYLAGVLDEDSLANVRALMSGQAMDAPIPFRGMPRPGGTKTALDSAVREMQEIATAKVAVREVLPDAAGIAFDSADEVYRTALRSLGIGVSGFARGACKAVFEAARHRARDRGTPLGAMAMDSAGSKSLAERYPHAAKIRTAW